MDKKYKLLTDYVMSTTEFQKNKTEIISWWTKKGCHQEQASSNLYNFFESHSEQWPFTQKHPVTLEMCENSLCKIF